MSTIILTNKKYGVIVLVFSEMLNLCLKMRKNVISNKYKIITPKEIKFHYLKIYLS